MQVIWHFWDWCLMLIVTVGPPLVALWGYYILLSAVLYHKHYIRVTGLIFPKNPNEFFFIFTIISLSLMESYGTILILLFESNKIKAMSTVRVHPTPKYVVLLLLIKIPYPLSILNIAISRKKKKWKGLLMILC